MSKRYDVMAPRPGREEGKTFWHRVGTAFEGEKGIGIVFDSLPIPDKDGRVSVRLFEPRPKQEPADIQPPMGNAPRRGSVKDTMPEDGDSIPF